MSRPDEKKKIDKKDEDKKMAAWYKERKNNGYEIQFYDNNGNNKTVAGCENLEDVAKVLIRSCNGQVKGNFPTVWLDGKLIRE